MKIINQKNKIFSFLFNICLFFCILLSFDYIVQAQFSVSIGYSFINMYSTINTNFLPYLGLSYILNIKSFSFSFFNSFYYSLDNFFINNLNLNLLFKSNINSFGYSIIYNPFNIFLIDNRYYPGNFIFTRFLYQSFKKFNFILLISAEYDQLTTNLIDSPIIFNIDSSISLPINKNIFTYSINIKYDTDDIFNYSLLKTELSSKITFFPTINEMIIPKISIIGGYSFNNTSGNFIGFAISNLFYSAITSFVTFSSELFLQYNRFLTSVLPEDIDYSEIKENLLFTVKYSNFVNSSHQLNVKLLYFPQENVPSNLNRAIIELKNTIFYSSSNTFIIDFLSSILYEYWFLQNNLNSFDLFFELILKFIPNKSLSLLLLNDLSTSFSSIDVLSEIYAQIKFMIVYYFNKNFSFEGLITYKGLNDKANDDFYQYFIINLSISYIF